MALHLPEKRGGRTQAGAENAAAVLGRLSSQALAVGVGGA